MQVPSPQAGKVQKVHVAKGQTVPVGAVLLTLEGAAKEPSPAKPAAAAPAAEPPAAPAPQAAAPPAKQAPAPQAAATPQPAAPQAATPVATAQAPAPVAPAASSQMSDAEVAAGPAVRRFAREVGVDLVRVEGTGPNGRITREDVLAVVRSTNQAASAPAATNGSGTPRQGERDAWGPVRIEKMTKIRKTIAAKMHESWSSVPRVTNFDDADVTELERIRVSSKDDYARKGIKLTSMPFVIKAVAMALRLHPSINAAIDAENESIVYKQYVNVGIAVDSERGLVVPSLRGPDEMSIADIARSLATLADNVRESSFSMSDLQGSTFTISNLGAIGGAYSTPIINTPEVAILLIGRSRKMPTVIGDKVEIRLMMPVSLSYDHRLVDGATAARFLNDVIEFLKTPSRLLLAP
jgi:pyruvate dehydrogenase E2 component (dihydrolipoamide acetyltransferase)